MYLTFDVEIRQSFDILGVLAKRRDRTVAFFANAHRTNVQIGKKFYEFFDQ